MQVQPFQKKHQQILSKMNESIDAYQDRESSIAIHKVLQAILDYPVILPSHLLKLAEAALADANKEHESAETSNAEIVEVTAAAKKLINQFENKL